MCSNIRTFEDFEVTKNWQDTVTVKENESKPDVIAIVELVTMIGDNIS